MMRAGAREANRPRDTGRRGYLLRVPALALAMSLVEMHVGPCRSAQLDDAVGPCLRQVSGQVHAEAPQFAEVLPLLRVLPLPQPQLLLGLLAFHRAARSD